MFVQETAFIIGIVSDQFQSTKTVVELNLLFIRSTSHTSNLSLQVLPLLPISNALPPSHNQQALPLPHPIYISLSDILPISQLTQILHLLLRSRHPKRIFIQDLEALEFQLRRR